jgi:hypothetical protein
MNSAGVYCRNLKRPLNFVIPAQAGIALKKQRNWSIDAVVVRDLVDPGLRRNDGVRNFQTYRVCKIPSGIIHPIAIIENATHPS